MDCVIVDVGDCIYEYEYERLISMNTKPSYRKLNHTCIGADRKHYKLQL